MKDELLSKATALFPFIASVVVQDIERVMMLILGSASALVSLCYTIFKFYLKLKENKAKAMEDFKNDYEKWKNDTFEK